MTHDNFKIADRSLGGLPVRAFQMVCRWAMGCRISYCKCFVQRPKRWKHSYPRSGQDSAQSVTLRARAPWQIDVRDRTEGYQMATGHASSSLDEVRHHFPSTRGADFTFRRWKQ